MAAKIASLALAGLSLALLISPANAQATSRCASIDPLQPHTFPSTKRQVLPEDILELRDIGPFEATEPLFSISPDGKSAALQLRQANAESNSYCQAIAVIPLLGGGPTLIDRGGDLIRADVIGVADLTVGSGIPKAITPLWSPDSRWVAFLKKEAGKVQVWKAWADGSGSLPLTNSQRDVDRFAVSPDGQFLVYVTKPDTAQPLAGNQQEGRSGYHYDERFIPATSSEPQLPGSLPEYVETLDLSTGITRSASDEERLLVVQSTTVAPKPRGYTPINRSQAQVWIEAVGGSFAMPTTMLRYQLPSGASISCRNSPCSNARGSAWLIGSGRRVAFLSREGWARGTTAIYVWVPGHSSPKVVLRTTDYLVDCRPLADDLLCLSEAATKPRRLIRIELRTGEVHTIFDPNPGWADLVVGKVRRLNVRNDIGLESTVDLVYPAQYRPGQRYPAIVVQYVSRGLLRGGVGDEYPILALAARGYVVLSVNRPPHVGLLENATDLVTAERLNLRNWKNRKSILSSIETPLRKLITEGLIDQQKIGITGLSDGATTVQYAMLHSQMFAAAIMSGCCWERNQGALLGPQIDRTFREVGYPDLLEAAPEFWKEISIIDNAKSIRVPLLLQAADSEYISALGAYTALRQANKAVDLFVFPNEFHNKWQPAHRLAIYRRTIRWFDFWLKNQFLSSGPDKKEVEVWIGLRKSLPSPN
ncbi:Atxe2 family lasso peptide isopeptidase [Blastomonas sp. CCH13-E1]|uniref:Atxe2 family lasso peptide isopeptidase n=1 Tax=Blastomonas sp. CCH13-E1 TaxID=1768739 RepID=UPI000AD9DEBD|nr:Atxe2 family lasso peptide isopeptidase [Blastomonas sp. CCH13-E1]